MAEQEIIIVSNRGPASFSVEADGTVVGQRGSGGLVSGLASLGESGAGWVAAAISDGDRAAAATGTIPSAGFDVTLLDIAADIYDAYYDGISNETLWFLHHGLWDLTREPAFDLTWRDQWEAYREVNRRFADAVVATAPEHAVILVQDYHLSLVGKMIAAERDDLRAVHFHHTPFALPNELDVLPRAAATELIDGLGGFRACGFHTATWAARYAACAGPAGVPSFVAPLGVDPETLRAEASSAETEAELSQLENTVGDRKFIVRVDRIELSKNLLRGFDAYDEFLTVHPAWRERVTFGAFVYPSREGVDAYASYRADVEKKVDQVNARHGSPDWQPVILETDDRYHRSLAALRRADVVVVNPIRDGLNLVAKEAAIINQHDAGIVLSDQAGVAAELGPTTDLVNPFDVTATANAIESALTRPADERAAQATECRGVACSRTPEAWLSDQLAAAGVNRGR